MTESHLPPHVLALLLDDMDAGPEAAEHAHECPHCSERLSTLREQATAFDRLVAATDDAIPAPQYDPSFLNTIAQHRRREQPRYRRWIPAAAAASLALLLMVPSVRAWVVTRLPQPRSPAQTMPVIAGPTTVTIPVVEPQLRVTLATAPASVSLRWLDESVSTARLSVDGEASLIALPDGFSISEAEALAVELSVPRSLERVVVFVGDTLRWTAIPGGELSEPGAPSR